MPDVIKRIQLHNVTKRFGFGDTEHAALDNVSLTINKGEFIAIMGPSGCGKTTLLNLIGLLDQPTEGEYYLDDTAVDNLSPRRHAKIRSRQIGFVFQNFNLLAKLSALENVAMPLIYAGVDYNERCARAQKALEDVGLGSRVEHKPNEMSGGQRQRVAIARALINDPAIIMADEPTGNLDTKSTLEIIDILEELNHQGKTVIMVTHEPELANMTQRIITMRDGKVTGDERGGKVSVS